MTLCLPPSFSVSTHDYHKHSRIASPIFLHAHFRSSHYSPILGIKICFLNGRKELPNQSFLFYFLYAATVGGRGVCVAQTCTDARSSHITAHIGATRPTPRSKWLRRYSFLTCAVVQPLVLRPQTALGSGFSLQAAFWHQNAMLALFLRSKKSLKRSLSLLSPFRTPHKILSFYTLDSVVAILVAMEI